MNQSKIIVHCLVKNEDRFIWYAIKSVLPFVDHIMVWDTGSTDKTVSIVKQINSPKISFKEMGDVNAETFTKVRNQMLAETPSSYDWLMILDGDEVWGEYAIKTVTDYARNNPKAESLVVRTRNLVGDIYHQLPESSGKYHLAGQVGHLNLRFINLKEINGLHIEKPHGQQGYYDGEGNLIQNRDQSKVHFIDVAYHHATHLQRSTKGDSNVIKRPQKFKLELGKKVDNKNIPEIFFASKPKIVPDVTMSASIFFWILSAMYTLPRRLKRKLFPSPDGY